MPFIDQIPDRADSNEYILQFKYASWQAVDKEPIDPAFVPFVRRINYLWDAMTVQCCQGHMFYRDGPPDLGGGSVYRKKDLPKGATDHWGYLFLAVSLPASSYLHRLVRSEKWAEKWLWLIGSQLHFKECRKYGERDFSVRPTFFRHGYGGEIPVHGDDHECGEACAAFAEWTERMPPLGGYELLGFAWDAKHWPTPAIRITEALESFSKKRK